LLIPEAEEVADVLLGGCGRDARIVDGGVARHYEREKSTKIMVKSGAFRGEKEGGELVESWCQLRIYLLETAPHVT
jgi:hypothetical protein